MTQRTDGHGNVTHIGLYDALNRPKSVSYTVAGPTPSVCYTYDQDASGLNHFKGALFKVTNLAPEGRRRHLRGATEYTYDALGRILTNKQTTGGTAPLPFAYEYSLTDQLTKITYPSGRQVSYALDAADRVSAVTNGVTHVPYASIDYTAHGTVSTTMTLGNNVVQKFSLNDRLQPVGIAATTGSNAPLLTMGLYPCASQATVCAAGNNGSLRSQAIGTPDLSVTQTYSYDRLSRLTQAAETGARRTGRKPTRTTITAIGR